MPDLADGEVREVQGSGSSVYQVKNVGGVYSCSGPAWRNQSLAIEKRTCKHLRRLRCDAAEDRRVGAAEPRARAGRAGAVEDGGAEGGEETVGKAAPPLLLAQAWDGRTDLAGWWLSEKLDGVRADAAVPGELGGRPARGRKAAAAGPAAAATSAQVSPAGGPGAGAAAGAGVRRFECLEGGASKFWEIVVAGAGHTVRFGRIGTQGQTRAKSFADAAAAAADAAQLIAEKTRKGYVERPGAAPPAEGASSAPAPGADAR